VGSAYNGKTLTLLHCVNSRLETLTATVKDGVASFSVNSFSPFALFATNAHISIPQTGDGGAAQGWRMLWFSAAAGFVATAVRFGKKKRRVE
jgi:hypothetical protein